MAKKKATSTANPLAAKMHRAKPEAPAAAAPAKQAKKKLARVKPVPKKKAAATPTGPVNVITDRRGQVFDPAVHAVHADGVTPHADSAGNFIRKSDHYDGAKKAHFADSFRHA